MKTLATPHPLRPLVPRLAPRLALLLCAFTAMAPAAADQTLATSKACMGCHAVATRLVGPSFKEIATRYKGQADAPTVLAGKIVKGSAGVWGPVPMPANAQVGADDARKLSSWILSGL